MTIFHNADNNYSRPVNPDYSTGPYRMAQAGQCAHCGSDIGKGTDGRAILENGEPVAVCCNKACAMEYMAGMLDHATGRF